MSGSWIALLSDLSGKVTFATLGIWALLRIFAFFAGLLENKPAKFFPISAQRLGFAQGLGTQSVILSEADYHAREKGLGFLQKLAKVWWPLIAWVSLTQFIVFFGAKGLSRELSIPFWLGLAMSCFAFLSLGFFRRRMIGDHLRESDLPEGKSLDWDDEAFMGGMRLRVRFEGKPRKKVLGRHERNVIAKDHAEQFHHHGIVCLPDSAHRHGWGIIVSEFRMLDFADESMVEENWTKKIKLRDVLQSVLSSFVLANELKKPAVALLEYPGAVVMITPLAEHIEFLEAVADRLMKRKRVPAMSSRDVALAAAQEFPSKFSELRVAEMLAHQDWVSKDKMEI
jgi:hypothetical protein